MCGAIFCRQIGAMLTAGVDLLRALKVAAEQSPNPRLKAVSRQLCLDLPQTLFLEHRNVRGLARHLLAEEAASAIQVADAG